MVIATRPFSYLTTPTTAPQINLATAGDRALIVPRTLAPTALFGAARSS